MSVCTICSGLGEKGRPCPKCRKVWVPPMPEDAKAGIAEMQDLRIVLAGLEMALDHEWQAGHVKMEGEILTFTCPKASAAQLGVNAAVMRLLELWQQLHDVRRSADGPQPNVPPPTGGLKH